MPEASDEVVACVPRIRFGATLKIVPRLTAILTKLPEFSTSGTASRIGADCHAPGSVARSASSAAAGPVFSASATRTRAFWA
jgi:hypothetical protein